MWQILVIAKQTFKEAVRNKILFIFIILSLIAICSSIFMPVIGDGGEKISIIESMCLRTITFFGMLAAILLSASSIPTDIENKLLWTITTKPISRSKLIFGKIIGFIYIVGLLLLIMGSASYVLIKFTALRQDAQNRKQLQARVRFNPVELEVTGKSAKKIGNFQWIKGGGKGASKWEFKGLYSRKMPDKFEIELKMFMQTPKRHTRRIPVNVKIINPNTGHAQTEVIKLPNNKPVSLILDSKLLGGSEELTIVVSPKETEDYIGMSTNSLSVFLGEKSFEYNFLKGLTIISSEFILMILIATLGSTFLSLPVNIFLCLCIFFCGNLIDFMRDMTTVMNLLKSHDHSHEHGISTVMKGPNIFVIFLNNIINKSLFILSYIIPNFKYFDVGHFFINRTSIPLKDILSSFGYIAIYVLFCLPVSFIIFRRREIA